MHVRWVELVGFRNYASLSFAPDPGLNVLSGANGQGKTSLLEALHVLLAGRSFRTSRLAECVAWDAAEARVAGEIVHGDQRREVRLVLHERLGGAEIRGTRCAWARAVTFAASDLALLTGPPAARRAYLDGAAAKLAPAHTETCRRYRLVLHQRARLLAHLMGGGDREERLTPWDEQVATLGSEIVHRRLETLGRLAGEAREIAQLVFPGHAVLHLAYAPVVAPGPDVEGTRRALLTALHASRAKDAQRGVTLVGPHRDDVVIRLGRADARTSASRGEQRLVTLSLRMAEAAAVRRRAGVAPVFLLDDLLSELDLQARQRVLTWLAAQGQALFSTSDLDVPVGLPAVRWVVHEAAVGPASTRTARGAA